MCYKTWILVRCAKTFIFFLFCSSGKKVYLMMQVSGVEPGNTTGQRFLPRTCSSRATRLRSYAPSITLQFSLVLVRLTTAIPLVHGAFHKSHLFTMNSDKQKIICWEKPNAYISLQNPAWPCEPTTQRSSSVTRYEVQKNQMPVLFVALD